MHYATRRKVVGSIPVRTSDFSIGLILLASLWSSTQQPLTERSTMSLPGDGRRPECKSAASPPPVSEIQIQNTLRMLTSDCASSGIALRPITYRLKMSWGTICSASDGIVCFRLPFLCCLPLKRLLILCYVFCLRSRLSLQAEHLYHCSQGDYKVTTSSFFQ
jgi:hypothetical protein